MNKIDLEKFMTVFETIERTTPVLVYISGKSGTGKTTLARALKDKNSAALIELDNVILELESPEGVNKFLEIYRGTEQTELVKQFITEVKKRITSALKEHEMVIIEGAIATNETLSAIVQDWTNDFLFAYLLPGDFASYKAQIISRFMMVTPDHNSGLPPLFWKLLDPTALEDFYNTKKISTILETGIDEFIRQSMEEAETRKDMFAEKFHNILVIGV